MLLSLSLHYIYYVHSIACITDIQIHSMLNVTSVLQKHLFTDLERHFDRISFGSQPCIFTQRIVTIKCIKNLYYISLTQYDKTTRVVIA